MLFVTFIIRTYEMAYNSFIFIAFQDILRYRHSPKNVAHQSRRLQKINGGKTLRLPIHYTVGGSLNFISCPCIKTACFVLIQTGYLTMNFNIP